MSFLNFLMILFKFIYFYILIFKTIIFKLFDSKMKIIRDESQHNDLERNSIVIYFDKTKNSSTIINFYRILNAF
jgi:hypothetical protein